MNYVGHAVTLSRQQRWRARRDQRRLERLGDPSLNPLFPRGEQRRRSPPPPPPQEQVPPHRAESPPNGLAPAQRTPPPLPPPPSPPSSPGGSSDESDLSSEESGSEPEAEEDEDAEREALDLEWMRGAVRRDGDPWEFREQELREGDNELDKLRLGAFFSKLSSSGSCSKEMAGVILRFFVGQAESIVRMKRMGVRFRSAKHLRERAYKKICPTTTTDLYKQDERGELSHIGRVIDKIPRELQNNKIARRSTSIQLVDCYRHALLTHGLDPRSPPPEWGFVDLLSDGVTFNQKGGWKFHFVCVSFPPCGKPYPLSIHNLCVKRGGRLNVFDLLDSFVEQINALGGQLTLRRTLGDGKERKMTKGMIATNGHFACETCLQPGAHLPDDYKTRRISYPRNEGENYERRSTERMRGILQEQRDRHLAAGQPRDFQWRNILGYQCWSPLLDLQNFGVVEQGPLDQMHQAVGLGEKIFMITYIEGPSSDSGNMEKKRIRRECINRMNDFLRRSKIPTEFGRRTREIDCPNFKSSEWRYLTMFAFPWLAASDLSREIDVRLRRVLLLYSFLLRALNVADEDFYRLRDQVNIEDLFRQLQTTYEDVLGPYECTFNEHTVFRHALETRETHGRLLEYSTWKLEATFARLKRCFVPGTRNEAKQMFNSFYADDNFFHVCPGQRTIKYRSHSTEKNDDSLVRVEGGDLYRIVGLEDDDRDGYGGDLFRCRRISVRPLETGEIIDLPWAAVGVWREDEGEADQEERNFTRKQMIGKLVKVEKLILDASNDLIHEL